MIFTFNRLKQHLNTEASIDQIIATLNHIGFEVEKVDNIFERYNQFKVAQIKSFQAHANATRLNVCIVDDGVQELQIICGASNVRSGMKVVLAPVGSNIPVNNMVIKNSTIRGINSNGMLCSAQELNLASSGLEAEGIIELSADAEVGANFASYYGLDDIIIDISITPNRGDTLSVYGIARDLAAAGLGELIYPYSSGDIKYIYEDFDHDIKEGCNFIILHTLQGVENGQSPDFIQRYLNKIGQPSKGALIDLSNFTMFDLGHPNHIYDADKIEGKITVRRSYQNERFIGINDIEYILPEGLLVIADTKKIVAIAGVMGSRDSKVESDTKNIIIEVANFNPAEVAYSGRTLNLHSESRYRFERKVDEGDILQFSQHLTTLIQKYCKGKMTDCQALIPEKKEHIIHLDYNKIYSIIGFHIAKADVETILNRLGYKIQGSAVLVPSHRSYTINNIADIAEEVLRIFGYRHLPSIQMPSTYIATCQSKEVFVPTLRQKIAHTLGMHEIISWSFMHSTDLEAFNLKAEVKIINPINSESDVMRPILLPNLLQISKENLSRMSTDFAIFECGHVFQGRNEILLITGLRVGYASRTNIHQSARKYDFYDVKADVWKLLEVFYVNTNSIIQTSNVPNYYHPTRAAEIKLGNKIVAYLGEMNPSILEKYDIKEPCVAFEFFPENIPLISDNIQYGQKFPDLQPICRDFSFVVNEEINFIDVYNAISKLRHQLIHKIELFDVYRDSKIAPQHKSIAIRVWLQPILDTLTDKEIVEISDAIIYAVQQKTHGKLRE